MVNTPALMVKALPPPRIELDSTVFVLWGWYKGADPSGQKLLGLYNTEEEATAHRDRATGQIIVFCLHEGYVGRAWEASLPGEIPRVVYFVQKEGDIFVSTDMVKAGKFLKHSYYQ